MDVLKIQYPPGTIVKDIETGERLRIEYYSGNKMWLKDVIDTDRDTSWDYFTQLGRLYVKDRTAQVLYGSKRNI